MDASSPLADITSFYVQEIGALLFGLVFFFLWRQSRVVYFGLWAVAWGMRIVAAFFGFELTHYANAAWLALAALAHNLLRAAGALAGLAQAKARGATLRRDLIGVAGRIARRGRGHLTVRLPEDWHREHEWASLFEAATGPPATAA